MNVSVLIATYGTEEWKDLAWSRAYPSAIEQTEDVASFHDPDGTIASVRNEMARTASGEWLLFLDADDELAPGYLDAMRASYEQEGTDGVPLLLTPAVSYIRKQKPERPKFWPGNLETFRTGNWLVIGTLVRRDFFWEVGGFKDFAHGLEDWNFWARCIRAGARVRKVPGAIYLAHWNDDSKHMKLAQNRPNYAREYDAALKDAWG
jgi:glycosyltransferase involved in cell wall biosynthesis